MTFYIFVLMVLFLLCIIIRLTFPELKGKLGEIKVASILKSLGSDFIVLNDVMLNTDNVTSQIDHIVLSEYGIFVIETKNYKGWIFGNEKSENWQQIIYDRKYSFRNPVKQNKSHVFALKKVLKDYSFIEYHSIVAFTGSAELKNIDSSVPVVYAEYLNTVIMDRCIQKSLTKDQLINIKSILEASDIKDKKSKQNHIQNIRQSRISTFK